MSKFLVAAYVPTKENNEYSNQLSGLFEKLKSETHSFLTSNNIPYDKFTLNHYPELKYKIEDNIDPDNTADSLEHSNLNKKFKVVLCCYEPGGQSQSDLFRNVVNVVCCSNENYLWEYGQRNFAWVVHCDFDLLHYVIKAIYLFYVIVEATVKSVTDIRPEFKYYSKYIVDYYWLHNDKHIRKLIGIESFSLVQEFTNTLINIEHKSTTESYTPSCTTINLCLIKICNHALKLKETFINKWKWEVVYEISDENQLDELLTFLFKTNYRKSDKRAAFKKILSTPPEYSDHLIVRFSKSLIDQLPKNKKRVSSLLGIHPKRKSKSHNSAHKKSSKKDAIRTLVKNEKNIKELNKINHLIDVIEIKLKGR